MSISRRKFLSWIGLAGLTVVGGQKADAATTKQFKGYPDSLAVLHDSILCLGCRRCEEACNKVNDLPKPDLPFEDLSVLDQKRRTTVVAHTVVNQYKTKNEDENDKNYYYKKQCNHCLEPACASACFVSAFTKTKEGPVIYDPSVCVGCRYCMIACPFEVPTYEYGKVLTPRVMKCTMCHTRIVKGLIPGCVESCPSGALVFGKRSKLIKIAQDRINKNSAYLDHIYGEHEMGGTSWLYLSGTEFENIELRTDLGVVAAGELTAPALGAVPMVVGLWPILLTGIYSVAKSKEAIANRQKNEAVKNAVDRAEEKSRKKLNEAAKKAEIIKTAAVEKEVKKALDKAKLKAETEVNSNEIGNPEST